jgi:hypothetical protein
LPRQRQPALSAPLPADWSAVNFFGHADEKVLVF